MNKKILLQAGFKKEVARLEQALHAINNYDEVLEALRAMTNAFDCGQTASSTSAIGKARSILGRLK
jgi:hypothetical protein